MEVANMNKLICDFCGKEKNKSEMTIFEKYEMCIDCKNEQVILNKKYKTELISRIEKREKDKNCKYNISQEYLDSIIDSTKNIVFFSKYIQDKEREKFDKFLKESEIESKRMQMESLNNAKNIFLD